jgi:quercetin dioxygenase-like cupin family protein
MSKHGRPTHGGKFDLAAIDSELRGSDAYTREGHTAHTLVREDDLRIVVIVMKAGARMAKHRADETASIHGLSGHVRLHLPDDETTDVHAGQLLVLERGVQHDVEAVLDSALVLTLGWPPAGK